MAQRNRKFKTDTAMSNYNRQNVKGHKILDIWVSSSTNDYDMRRFDLGFGTNNDNGWDVNDMFRRNEMIYGVKSTFDESLKGYTTEIKRDASNFKELEAKAARLAKEIQRNSISQKRAELENCDEEEIFTADLRKNKRNNKSQRSPESQQNYYNNRYSQKNQNNQHKSSKSPINEWQNVVSGSGTNNFYRSRRQYVQN